MGGGDNKVNRGHGGGGGNKKVSRRSWDRSVHVV